jgi:hypothetical protein
MALHGIPKQQARYWKEVNDSYGLRLLLAPQGAQGNWWKPNNLVSFISPYSGAINGALMLSGSGKGLSIPATLAITVGASLAWQFNAGAKLKEDREVLGAGYINRLKDLKLLYQTVGEKYFQKESDSVAVDILQRHLQTLIAWNSDKSGKAILPRIQEFVDYGLIHNQQELDELNRLAHNAVPPNYCPDPQNLCSSAPPGTAKKITIDFMKSLLDSPLFKDRPDNEINMFAMIFTPPLTLKSPGKLPVIYSDMRILNAINTPPSAATTKDRLDGVRNLRTAPAPVAISFAMKILENPKLVDEREAAWKQMGHDDKPIFAERPALQLSPAMQTEGFDQDGTGTAPKKFTNELELWNLAWTDPRFSKIRMPLAEDTEKLKQSPQPVQDSGEMLQSLESLVGEYDRLYSLGREIPHPTDQQLCALLGILPSGNGNPEHSDLVANATNTFLRRLSGKPNLKLAESCAISIAEVTYQGLLEEGRTPLENHTALMKVLSAKENAALEACPKPKTRLRSCSPRQAPGPAPAPVAVRKKP